MRNTNFRTWNMERNTEEREKWKMQNLDQGYSKKTEIRKMRNIHCRTWKRARNTQKLAKWEITTCRTWNMARKMKNVENDTQTLYHLEYGEKYWKWWKMKNAHCRTLNMARKLKSWIVRNKYCRTWNMARNTEKLEKWELHTVGPGLWRENWKTWKMRWKHCMNWNMVRNTEKGWKWEMQTVGHETGWETLKILENEKHTL